MTEIEPPKLELSIENITKELFQEFQKNIHNYFETAKYNDKPNEDQVDILKNLIGPDLNTIYNLQKDVNRIKKEDINHIFNVLQNYFDGKLENFILQKFFTRKQKRNETFEEFYNDLMKLLPVCKFGDQKNKILKAQIILGIKDKIFRKTIIDGNLQLDDIVSYLKSFNEHAEETNSHYSEEDDVLSDDAANFIKIEPKIEEEYSGPNCTVTSEENSKDILEPNVIIKEEIVFESDEIYTKNNPMFPQFTEENSELTNNVSENSTDVKFACDLCSKSFKSIKSLKRHNFLQHTKEKDIDKLTCPTCHKVYSSISAVKHHQKIHLGIKDYVCDICSKAFRQNHDLQLHLRRHKGDRDKECEICHYKFYRNTELAIHMQTVHSDKRPICCEICGKQLKSKNHLKYHMRGHTGERPYKCDLCPKAFSLKTTMQNHRLIHTGERNHICELCGRGFTEKGQLKKHMITHRDRTTTTNTKPKFNKRNLQYSQPSTS